MLEIRTASQLAEVDPTELCLGRSATSHRARTADPAGSGHEHSIGVFGAGPRLVLDDFASVGNLLLLDHVGVRLHPVGGERFSEPVRDQSVGMQTGEGDELPARRVGGGSVLGTRATHDALSN